MRKDAIVKEYKQIPKNGIHIMDEKSNFLISKMMDIEDIIYIQDKDYSFLPDSLIELKSNYSYDLIKKQSLSIELDKAQSIDNENTLTNWIFKLNSKQLLVDYLYAEILTYNPHSPFREFSLDIISNTELKEYCLNYIYANVLSRYKLKEFILYVKYSPISTGVVKYKLPEFNKLAKSTDNKQKISIKEYNNGVYEVNYKQLQSSQNYGYIYYVDFIFEKI